MPNRVVEYLQEQIIRTQQYREQQRNRLYPESVNVHLVSLLNQHIVLNRIRRYGSISRADLATDLQLSRSTVSDIVSSLKERGLLEEGNTQSSTIRGGKPALEIKFKADAGYVIGVDIGRSHLTILLRNLNAQDKNGHFPWIAPGNSFYDDRWSYSQAFETGRGADACLREIASKLHQIVEENKLQWDDVLGIGIAIPGTVDRNRERLTRAVMMAGWNDINIPNILRSLLNVLSPIPLPIYLDNDCNYGALGEYRYGAGRMRPKSTILYIKVGNGVGAGLIINGQPYRGSGGSAGEFGHQSVRIDEDEQDERAPICATCGKSNCLESYVAEPAIVRAANLPGTESIENAVEKVRQGDNQARFAIHKAGGITGRAIRNFINVLDPHLILLDGSVVRAAGELFMVPLSLETELCIPAAKGSAEIRRADLGSSAIAYGAIASVLDEAFPD